MKQMGQVLNMYANDRDGFLPTTACPGYLEPYWPYLVIEYFDNYELFLCPSQPKNWERLYYYYNTVTKKWNLPGYYSPSFGANNLVFGYRISLIQIPTETILLVDSMANNLVSGYGYYVSKWYGEGNTWVSSRHNGGTNILWADTHVSWKKTDQVWAIPEAENRKYWWKQAKN
jgi:prepilin-type processing-associated H-X9-DG protein